VISSHLLQSSEHSVYPVGTSGPTTQPKKVLVTGAAGNIGYALCPLIAQGDMLGPDQPIILHLLEIAAALEKAEAVAMELRDCAFPLLKDILVTSDETTAFTDVDFVIFVGAYPRKQGMERKDMIEINAKIFAGQGKILDQVAKKSVKVLVVGNPANTNCLITATAAPSLNKHNFSALTRLDHNRAHYQVAAKANVAISQVKNVCIWGNHSNTQFPDLTYATINSRPATQVFNKEWIENEFVSTVQQRGAVVIQKRGLSSACSAAKAIVDHMHDWVHGTPQGEFVSMGVLSDGSYGIPAGLIYSFPVTISSNGEAKIVQGLAINDFARKMMDRTAQELLEEKAVAFKICGL